MGMKKIVVNDRMQQGYHYFCTEPAGRNFAPEFRPGLTPKEMLRLGVFGGRYMTDCAENFRELVRGREAVCRAARPSSQLLRRQRVAVARRLAAERLDSAAGSARMVSMVLPLLPGPPDRGRRAADPAVARDRAARRGDSEELREGRSRLPPPAAAGRPALGLRQPAILIRPACLAKSASGFNRQHRAAKKEWSPARS
jgi:hypothetical protein